MVKMIVENDFYGLRFCPWCRMQLPRGVDGKREHLVSCEKRPDPPRRSEEDTLP